MYNSVINDWKDVEHQIPFDVRQPKTHAYRCAVCGSTSKAILM